MHFALISNSAIKCWKEGLPIWQSLLVPKTILLRPLILRNHGLQPIHIINTARKRADAKFAKAMRLDASSTVHDRFQEGEESRELCSFSSFGLCSTHFPQNLSFRISSKGSSALFLGLIPGPSGQIFGGNTLIGHLVMRWPPTSLFSSKSH